MARHRTAREYYQPPPPPPPSSDIDWMGAAKVGAIAGAPVVGGVALYGRGLAEQGVPKGNTLNALRREIANKTYGSITGTMAEGLKSYGRGTKEGAGSSWQALKDAFRGTGGGSLQQTVIKYRPRKFMSNIERLVQLNAKLNDEIQFADKDRDYLLPAVGVGAVGTGAAGYGLYRKGLGMPGRPPSERSRVITNRKGVERDPGYFTRTRELAPAKRGIIGNIVVGGQQVRHEAALAPSLLSHPMARQAISHDIRSSVSSRLAKIAHHIKP